MKDPKAVADPRAQLVGQGYDEIGERFDEWRDSVVGDPRERWLNELTSRLFEGARVLELGCGSGLPETRLLAERYRVTGVDVSVNQIKRARKNVPTGRFVHADLTSLELPPASFEAVVAFYTFNHVPRELLPMVFERVYGWLTPEGYFLVSLGTEDTPGWTGEWLGATMFFSGYPPETNRRLLDEAGFTRVLDDVVTFTEPEGDATFQWVLARSGVGSTEPPCQRRLDGAGQRAEVAASPPPQRKQSDAPGSPAQERSGVGSTEPPKSDAPGSPAQERSGVGSTEPPCQRRLDGAGQRAEVAASPPPQRKQSDAPALPAQERE